MISIKEKEINIAISSEEILQDYRTAYQSRQASLLGRREVLSGKAKFGIFGDGKEIAQVAMAKAFRKGDIRSGYYRDQTFMFALGMSNIQEFFAQMYANPDVNAEPASAGRSMNGHFATRMINENGSWKTLVDKYQSSADVSPTGSQMPRLVGLAYASKLYRELDELQDMTQFSDKGGEIAFGTIGNASCAEGMFWESVNAVGVLGAPMLLSIWDDGYGISVPNKYQVTKENISELLKGFKRKRGSKAGYDIYVVPGWDYPALVETYMKAAAKVRKEHVPAIVHVVEVTQPQGHSTSGSHERYKSKERLQWETEHDCIAKMRSWMIAEGIATEDELAALESNDKKLVYSIKDAAWDEFTAPIRQDMATAAELIDDAARNSPKADQLAQIKRELLGARDPLRKDVHIALTNALMEVRSENTPAVQKLARWKNEYYAVNRKSLGSHLYSETSRAALNIAEIKPRYSDESPSINGSEILKAGFDAVLARDPRVVVYGEDVGQLGDVNQGLAGLQAKYGPLRVSDTGIRECTIVGQAIGMAMRGLRPIAEIQYLDYLLYALQIMSDDLATVQYRTKGGQIAPVIVRTRGHRLEGIWHSGSPMGGILNLVRGMYVLVPRDMTRAAGFYNTMLQSDDPCIIVEVLNGYRLKERLPANIGEFTVPVGVPETLRAGSDATLVTYGANCRIAMQAAQRLAQTGIEIEVIDVQSLLPFDIHDSIVESIKRTNRVVFLDEDVPGGASAFMMQQVMERQGAYRWLDSAPLTITAAEHRPAYGSDGNHWSKPGEHDVFEAVYAMMHEADPARYPLFFK